MSKELVIETLKFQIENKESIWSNKKKSTEIILLWLPIDNIEMKEKANLFLCLICCTVEALRQTYYHWKRIHGIQSHRYLKIWSINSMFKPLYHVFLSKKSNIKRKNFKSIISFFKKIEIYARKFNTSRLIDWS